MTGSSLARLGCVGKNEVEDGANEGALGPGVEKVDRLAPAAATPGFCRLFALAIDTESAHFKLGPLAVGPAAIDSSCGSAFKLSFFLVKHPSCEFSSRFCELAIRDN